MAPPGRRQPLIWINGIALGMLFCSANQPPVEAAMLAEKFFLVLETLRSHASDGSVKVISTAPHVPANVLPSQK